MIENLQEKLHQGKHKQSKEAKICASIRWELSMKNAPKLSAKYLRDKICKNFLEKRNPNKDSSKTTIS